MGSVNDIGGVDILASSPCTALMIVSSDVFAIRIGADISNAGDFIQWGPPMIPVELTSWPFQHVNNVLMIVSNEVFAQY